MTDEEPLCGNTVIKPPFVYLFIVCKSEIIILPKITRHLKGQMVASLMFVLLGRVSNDSVKPAKLTLTR